MKTNENTSQPSWCAESRQPEANVGGEVRGGVEGGTHGDPCHQADQGGLPAVHRGWLCVVCRCCFSDIFISKKAIVFDRLDLMKH